MGDGSMMSHGRSMKNRIVLIYSLSWLALNTVDQRRSISIGDGNLMAVIFPGKPKIFFIIFSLSKQIF